MRRGRSFLFLSLPVAGQYESWHSSGEQCFFGNRVVSQMRGVNMRVASRQTNPKNEQTDCSPILQTPRGIGKVRPSPSDRLKSVADLRGPVSPVAFESRVGADIDARQLCAVLVSHGSRHFKPVPRTATRIEVDDDIYVKSLTSSPRWVKTASVRGGITSLKRDRCIDAVRTLGSRVILPPTARHRVPRAIHAYSRLMARASPPRGDSEPPEDVRAVRQSRALELVGEEPRKEDTNQ